MFIKWSKFDLLFFPPFTNPINNTSYTTLLEICTENRSYGNWDLGGITVLVSFSMVPTIGISRPLLPNLTVVPRSLSDPFSVLTFRLVRKLKRRSSITYLLKFYLCDFSLYLIICKRDLRCPFRPFNGLHTLVLVLSLLLEFFKIFGSKGFG